MNRYAKHGAGAPDPTDATQGWDRRWDAEQRRNAVWFAKDRLRRRIEELERASRAVEEAADWVGSVAYFKAGADAREAGLDA